MDVNLFNLFFFETEIIYSIIRFNEVNECVKEALVFSLGWCCHTDSELIRPVLNSIFKKKIPFFWQRRKKAAGFTAFPKSASRDL